MSTRWARFFRGWTAAGFATLVAALSHTFAGGGTPGLLAVVVSLAFAGIICIGMAGRTLSLWRTSVSVLASQLIFHGLFALTGAADTGTTALVQQPFVGVHHHALALSIVTTGSSSGGAHSIHGVAGFTMLAAHTIAAVLTILALRHGEKAIAGLLVTARLVIRCLVPRLADAIAPAAPRQSVHTAPVVTAPVRDALISPMRHRGPPLPAGAFARRSQHVFA